MKTYKTPKSIFLLLFLTFSFLAFSQKVNWTHPQKFDDKFPNVKIFGYDPITFYMYKYGEKPNEIIIENYDNELKILIEKNIKLKDKSGEVSHVYFWNEQFLLFYIKPNLNNGVLEFYVQKINKNGIFDGEPIKLDEKIYLGAEETHEGFLITPSKNNEQLLVAHVCPQLICHKNEESKNEKNTTLFYKVYDKNLQRKWDAEIELPYLFKEFSIEKIVIDNSDKVYVLAMNYKNLTHSKIPGAFNFIMHVYDQTKKESKNNDIDFNKLFITDLGFAVNEENNNVTIAGFYSSEKTFNVVGVVYGVLETDNNLIGKRGFSPFSSLFTEHIALEQPDKDEVATVKYNLNEVLLNKEGGAIIIAEGYSERQAEYYNAATQNNVKTNTYEYSNIVIASISDVGRLNWQQTITKRQISENDFGYYSSYQIADYNNKLNFIFNEAIKREPDVLQYYTIDKTNGDMYAWLLINAHEDALIMPKAGIRVKENRLVIPSLRKGKFSFVDISF